MSSMGAEGWAKIATVEGQRWTEPVAHQPYDGTYSEQVVDEMVWIVDTAGNVWAVSLLKGETLDGLVAHYTARGWTDARCCFFKAAENNPSSL